MVDARYVQTKAYGELLAYVTQSTYRDLRSELYDRYLWFYNDLEALQHRAVYGKRQVRHRCYIAGEANARHGAALLRFVRQRSVLLLSVWMDSE